MYGHAVSYLYFTKIDQMNKPLAKSTAYIFCNANQQLYYALSFTKWRCRIDAMHRDITPLGACGAFLQPSL